jgi:hypothetical protein
MPPHCWISLVAAGCFATSLAAQDLEAERTGMSGTVGLSVGSAGMSCAPECSGNRLTGPLFLARGGAHLTPQLSIFIEGDLFRKPVAAPAGDGEWRMSWYMLGLLWYPRAEEDFFVSVGVGLVLVRSHVTFPSVTAGPLALNTSDVGGSVGVGRDIRISDRIAITAYGALNLAPRSAALIGRSNSGARISADVVHAGLAVTLF